MPKMKTNKSVAKRFKVTGKGKVRRGQAFKSHILTKKTQKRKRHLRKAALCAPGDAKRMKRMLRGG
jgi:large subunit ribosomal protein L35